MPKAGGRRRGRAAGFYYAGRHARAEAVAEDAARNAAASNPAAPPPRSRQCSLKRLKKPIKQRPAGPYPPLTVNAKDDIILNGRIAALPR